MTDQPAQGPAVRQEGSKLIVRYVRVEEFELDLDEAGKLKEPQCPKCHSGVMRQKCFELGDACPRHPLKDAYLDAVRDDPKNHRFKPFGYEPSRCALCLKSEGVHHD